MSIAPARRWPCLLAIALVAALASVTWPAGADASEAPEDGSVELHLAEMTGVVGPGLEDDEDEGDAVDFTPGAVDLEGDVGDQAPRDGLALRLLVTNRAEQAVDNLRVVIEIHPPVDSRVALTRALDGGGPETAPIHITEEAVRDLGEVGPGEVAGVLSAIDHDLEGWSDEDRVHPLRIAVLHGATVEHELHTAVVWLQEPPTSPLLTTFVWPFTERPWRAADGSYPTSALDTVRDGGRLDGLLRALEQDTDAGVLLAPAAHLLEDLREQASGFTRLEWQDDGTREHADVEPEANAARVANDALQRLRDVVDELPHQPVAGTYADADLDGLLEHDQPMRELAGDLVSLGRSRLQTVIDRAPDTSTFVLDAPVRPEALDLVPAEHLLVAPGVVAAGDHPGDELRQIRAPSGRLLTASVADEGLAAHLADPELSGQLGAQRVLAETAMIHLEEPDGEGRSLTMHPPADWDPDPEMLRGMLEGLDRAPWLRLVSAGEQAALGRRSASSLELRAPTDERLTHNLVEDLETALTDLGAAEIASPEDVDEEIPRAHFRELRDVLLRATSRRIGAGEAEGLVEGVQREIDDIFGGVEVASGSLVTLTAESGQVPITVRRTGGGPISIRVEVLSRGGLDWPEGRESERLVLSEEEANTVTFTTEALTTGTFPVTVLVTDPSGTRELERATMSVRSTAVSGPALSATGALVVLLLLLGALRRTPRGPRLQIIDGVKRGDRRY